MKILKICGCFIILFIEARNIFKSLLIWALILLIWVRISILEHCAIIYRPFGLLMTRVIRAILLRFFFVTRYVLSGVPEGIKTQWGNQVKKKLILKSPSKLGGNKSLCSYVPICPDTPDYSGVASHTNVSQQWGKNLWPMLHERVFEEANYSSKQRTIGLCHSGQLLVVGLFMHSGRFVQFFINQYF